MDTHVKGVRWTSGINILAGLWTIISPFVFSYSSVASLAWNNLILGVVVALIGLERFLSPDEAEWLSGVNVIIGLWLILSNFFLAFPTLSARWDEIIIGAVIAVLGALSYRDTRLHFKEVKPSIS